MTLSTHVLDATSGRPAAEVQVRLERAEGDGWAPAGGGLTGPDGRLRLPDELDQGIYRITFEITDAGEHYHVPLLLSPFAYSTYRGS